MSLVRDADGWVWLDGQRIGKATPDGEQIGWWVATEDGSMGYKGTVIDLLIALWKEV